ncbi:putative mediator of RNA polymerase II transcription subunit 26 [Lucilia cuprina]|uniref:putative mediator of RNA polymerase II transcription subunit 26 n=1 Tax=Lucilia cuprina TaxID=7375 RepID=UPI001F06E6DE|nr:putative mediator of RNA polymerase II transcription subunit 26 [Lucilia cuprina]
MRVFLLTLFAGLTFAAPQGYNNQIELGSSENSIQAIPNEFQILQQQLEPQIIYQEQLPQLEQLTQSFNVPQQSGYQFDDQLLQKAQQQILQYENQLKQSQQQPLHVLSLVEQAPPIETKPVVESPKVEHKAEIVNEPQTQFIIQPKIKNKAPEKYHQPIEEKKVSFQKEFYYLSAPPEEYEPPKDLDKQLAALKKNLRVVFIKAPESNGLENAALQLAQQSANAQTAIYVLTKQHDAAELAQKLQSVQTSTPQRPEVAFIKYRTQEEAEHAQRVIQAQYEALDGPNHINRPDTGVTHNFVGATGTSNGVVPRKSLAVDDKTESIKPVSKYLPAAVKH